MLIYLSWTNVIISGDTFFNTINKTSTSVIDGTYPTFVLFTLVRFGVITISLPYVTVIIFFSISSATVQWGIWLLNVTHTLFKGIDRLPFYKIMTEIHSSNNNYYYNTQKWKNKGENGAYHSVLYSILPHSNVGKFPTHNVPMKHARILSQLKCCLLSLICQVVYNI